MTIKPISCTDNPNYTTPLLTKAWRWLTHLVLGILHNPFAPRLTQTQVTRQLSHLGSSLQCDFFSPQDPKKLGLGFLDTSKENRLFIPLVLKGCLNHITFFAVDKAKNEIIFYDSEGETIADHGLLSFYDQLKTLLSDSKNATFRQNTTKEQSDWKSCGIYVACRIKTIWEQSSLSLCKALASLPSMPYSEICQKRVELLKPTL